MYLGLYLILDFKIKKIKNQSRQETNRLGRVSNLKPGFCDAGLGWMSGSGLVPSL